MELGLYGPGRRLGWHGPVLDHGQLPLVPQTGDATGFGVSPAFMAPGESPAFRGCHLHACHSHRVHLPHCAWVMSASLRQRRRCRHRWRNRQADTIPDGKRAATHVSFRRRLRICCGRCRVWSPKYLLCDPAPPGRRHLRHAHEEWTVHQTPAQNTGAFGRP